MSKNKEIKIPKDQIKWESILDRNKNVVQIITSDITKTKWTLFDVVDGKLVKVETGSSPRFEKKFMPRGKSVFE